MQYAEIVKVLGTAVSRTVGIEMEGDYDRDNEGSPYNQSFPHGAIGKDDCSLGDDGIEVNTQPMHDLSEVYDVFRAMEEIGWSRSRRAGTHVHVSNADYTAYDVLKFLRFMAMNQTIMFSMVGDYRYNNSWCQLMPAMKWEGVLETKVAQKQKNVDLLWNQYLGDDDRVYENYDRYWFEVQDVANSQRGGNMYTSWVHPCNYGTFEFRLFNCVERADEAIAFGLLAHNITETVKNSTVEQLDFITEEIWKADSPEGVVAKFCEAMGLPAYPIVGHDAFREVRDTWVPHRQREAV